MENWKDIKGFEGRYQVSDCGNVRSLDTYQYNSLTKGQSLRKGKNLIPWLDKGYPRVGFYITEKRNHKYFVVHRLVAEHFIALVEGKFHVNHIDGNPLNNHYSNLEWCTPAENVNHAVLVLERAASQRLTFNTQTGIFYTTIIDAVKASYSHIPLSTVRSMLQGASKNRTTLIRL